MENNQEVKKENPYKVFADDNNINLEFVKVPARLDGLMSDSKYPMDHWICTLKVPYKDSYSFYYSKGSGHKGKAPRIVEVLESFKSDLLMDISSFENFCDELGYNADSIKDYKIFEACQKADRELRKCLGSKLCDELIAIED